MRMVRPHHAAIESVDVEALQNRRAFTLIEMIVVLGIIVMMVTMVVPAVSTIWRERKNAEADNTVQGLLKTARAYALASGSSRSETVSYVDATGIPQDLASTGGESGLFFFLDDSGIQRVVSIRRASPLDLTANSPVAWSNVFAVTDARNQEIPVPMRVLPRYAIDDPEVVNGDSWDTFTPEELHNQIFETRSSGTDGAQRHPNFFTMIFSGGGHLLVSRDVLILDVDADGDRRGDRTGMHVGPAAATTNRYFAVEDTLAVPLDSTGLAIPFLITDESTTDVVAINFPSIDGLLVYDQSAFQTTNMSQKRQALLDFARPLYVSRWTGAVVRGPVGESETLTP